MDIILKTKLFVDYLQLSKEYKKIPFINDIDSACFRGIERDLIAICFLNGQKQNDSLNLNKAMMLFTVQCRLLDSLCHNSKTKTEAAFRQLHMSLLDAVDINRDKNDYFKYIKPYQYNIKYLGQLVDVCRNQIKKLNISGKSINIIKNRIYLYTDVQSYRYLNRKDAQESLKTWSGYHNKTGNQLFWWEFAAASAAVMGICQLISFYGSKNAGSISCCYFPWVCCVYGLLEGLLKKRKDIFEGKISFVNCYENLKMLEQRLLKLISITVAKLGASDHCPNYKKNLESIILMYLSDREAFFGLNTLLSQNIAKSLKFKKSMPLIKLMDKIECV